MQTHAQIKLSLANDRIASLVREAAQSRLAREARPSRPDRSMQRWVGRSMIRLGERLSAWFNRIDHAMSQEGTINGKP